MSSTNKPRPVRCRASSTLGTDLPTHLPDPSGGPLPAITGRFRQRPPDQHCREVPPVLCGPLDVRGRIYDLRRCPSRLFESLPADFCPLKHPLRFGDAQRGICHASEHYTGRVTSPVADLQGDGGGHDSVVPGAPGELLQSGEWGRSGETNLHDHLFWLQGGHKETEEELRRRDHALAFGSDRTTSASKSVASMHHSAE